MKLAIVMIALIAVILAVSWTRLPFGNIPSPTDIQGTIIENVSRSVR